MADLSGAASRSSNERSATSGQLYFPNLTASGFRSARDSFPTDQLGDEPAGSFNAVWSIGGAWVSAAGIHCGPGAWDGILNIIPGGAYRRSFDHLRSKGTFADAVSAYVAEAGRRSAPVPFRVFLWA